MHSEILTMLNALEAQTTSFIIHTCHHSSSVQCDVTYTVHGRSCLVLESSRKQCHCHAISDAYGLIMLVIQLC
jgi:hypothetical protein